MFGKFPHPASLTLTDAGFLPRIALETCWDPDLPSAPKLGSSCVTEPGSLDTTLVGPHQRATKHWLIAIVSDVLLLMVAGLHFCQLSRPFLFDVLVGVS